MYMTVLLMRYCVMYNLGGNYFLDVVWSIDLPLEEKCVCAYVCQMVNEGSFIGERLLHTSCDDLDCSCL